MMCIKVPRKNGFLVLAPISQQDGEGEMVKMNHPDMKT
jgi:hypothetical protein